MTSAILNNFAVPIEDEPEHLPRAVLSPLFKNSSSDGSEELSPVKCLFGILISSLSQLILLTHKACLSLVYLNPIQAAPSLGVSWILTIFKLELFTFFHVFCFFPCSVL